MTFLISCILILIFIIIITRKFTWSFLIDLEIVPFNPTSASENDWKKYHTFRKVRHDETSPNLPTVSNFRSNRSMHSN